ncbi:hypothetical protein BH23ACT5_BH23ACT5_12470 [soil metagenome]
MTPRWTIIDFVVVALGGLAGALVFGVPAMVWGEGGDAAIISSIVGQYLGHLGVLWLLGRGRGLGAESLGFEIRPGDILYVGLGVAFQIVLAIVFIPAQRLLVPEGGAQDMAEIFGQLGSPAVRIAVVAVTAVLAPLVEELMFRGVLLRSLAHRSRRTVLVTTSVVFAAFHLTGVSSVPAGILIFTQIFIVGLFLGHLTLRHERIGPAIFVHGGFNLVAALILLIPPELLEELQQSAA